MKRQELFGAIVAVGILLAVGIFWFVDESGEKEPECVKVKTTCCPCNMGGQEKCVLISEVEDYEKNLSECSVTTLCTAVFNCKIESCEYVDGECVGI